jgi:hypothetical protein
METTSTQEPGRSTGEWMIMSLRENMIALAKLNREAITLQDEFLTELAEITKVLEQKYFPRLKAIEEASAQLRETMKNHASLVEEIHWHVYDAQNHDTDVDTTKRMKKNFNLQKKARTLYEIK